MKLELKHLAPYLPYGLNLRIKNYNSLSWSVKLNIDNYLNNFDKRYINDNIESIKPILRPLSDLTKEIEVNEEKFVPIYKLFEIQYKDTSHVDLIREMYFKINYTFTCSSHYATAMETSINTKNIQMNNYWKIEKLFEWHFDVFGLIEKGLAIDINTTKKINYEIIKKRI
jgi:hypothetical protein